MADLRICFSYMHTDAPQDGSNNFTRALRQYISGVPDCKIIDDLRGSYDVLFMNQLSRAPGRPYALSEIRAALDGERKKKLVVRAINLERTHPNGGPMGHFLRRYVRDRRTLELLHAADFVIFQSAFQKDLFERSGYQGKSNNIIHNGAAPAFLNGLGGAKQLKASDDLVLVSSAISANKTKRQEIIAALSLIRGARVIHCGAWPNGLDKAKVELAGVLSHDDMARLYERAHYFLHPAVLDICPNSLVEGLCAGLPAIYNSGPGSGSELGGRFGIPLSEDDLRATIAVAREKYKDLASGLAVRRHYYSIGRAALSYLGVFRAAAQG